MCGATRRSVLAGAGAAATTLLAVPPVEASGQLPRATIEARRKFFGAANVDRRTGSLRRDRVVLSWFGCASFAMAIGGRVVLLDAWVPRGLYSDRVPTDAAEVAALRPTHVFIGHGHFDHAADAGPIAAASSAVVVGTTEHCAQAASQAPDRIRTRPLRDLRTPGDRTDFRLGKRIRVTAVRHVHSEATAPSGDDLPLLLPPDLLPVLTHPPTLEDGLDTLSHQTDAEGGCLLYRFQVGDFSMVWHDSAGPIRDTPRVERALRRLPPTTVQVGAIQGFGQFTNGLRDPLDYVRAIGPRIFVPSHHDNWLPPISAPAHSYEGRLREGLAGVPAARRPALRFIRDTDDYVDPRRLTFRV